MGARFNCEHDVFGSENTRHRIHASRYGLTQEYQVRLDAAPFMTQQSTRPRYTSLDFITDHEDIVPVTESSNFF